MELSNLYYTDKIINPFKQNLKFYLIILIIEMDKGKASRGYTIIKKESETGSNYDTETYTSDDDDETSTPRFNSIVNSNYKKPRGGTVQDNMSKSEIKKKLIGYKSLKTQESKKYLLTLNPFKTWIKYYNPSTKQFRTGGLLMKVDPELRFIMLVNTNSNLTWSVQLADNIIFVPDPKKKEEEDEQKRLQEEQAIKEDLTKDKLYKLYISGKLKKV
jgi:hypothetical protein